MGLRAPCPSGSMRRDASLHSRPQEPRKAGLHHGRHGETVTYRQLDEQSNRIAQLFRSLGLKTGDGIALFMENNPRFFEICWAAQRSGLIYTAISSRLTAGEVEYIVKDCGAKLFVTSKYLAPRRAELAPLHHGRRSSSWWAARSQALNHGKTTVARMPATPIADQIAGHDMLYSSGTTGRPKGVRRWSSRSRSMRQPAARDHAMLYGMDENTSICRPRRSITRRRCAST